jgi:hypothetical protein
MRVWRKDGMTWPDIAAGGSVEMEASMALATELEWHLLLSVWGTHLLP